ncbi:MAG TPA: Fic family protein, partial [Polyangium sp.]|nr:Fic family protein [Polyangium sp.]
EERPKKREAAAEEERPKKKKKKKVLGEKTSVEKTVVEPKPAKAAAEVDAPVKTKLKLKKKKKKSEAAREVEAAETPKKKVEEKAKPKETPADKPREKLVKKTSEGKEKPTGTVSEKTKVHTGEKPAKVEPKGEPKAESKSEPKAETKLETKKKKKKKLIGKPEEKDESVKTKSAEGEKVVSSEKVKTKGEKKSVKSDKPAAEGKPRTKEDKAKAEPKVTAVREPAPRVAPIPLPLLAPIRKPTIEERSEVIEKRLESQTEEFRRAYTDRFDMSWIFHDSALEGVVYTFEELRSGLGSMASHYADTGMQPTYDDIRKHKEAIDFVRDYAKKKLPITIDVIRKIYLILHPEEGDVKTVKYRKDIPQHRLYFHEYAPPDKIPYKVRQIVDWLNDPETRKTRNALRIAARAHYDLLRVYPFQSDSGKVARLFMNLLLMRSGLPPSIIHSTERQRYYEALKGQATTVLQMVQEAVENALSSVEKLLDEYETRKRAFVS